MHQYAGFGDVVDVIDLDFEVEDVVGAAARDEATDAGKAAVGFLEMLAGVKCIGPDELLQVC